MLYEQAAKPLHERMQVPSVCRVPGKQVSALPRSLFTLYECASVYQQSQRMSRPHPRAQCSSYTEDSITLAIEEDSSALASVSASGEDSSLRTGPLAVVIGFPEGKKTRPSFLLIVFFVLCLFVLLIGIYLMLAFIAFSFGRASVP